MKFVIVFAALFSVVMAASLSSSKDAHITRWENDNIGVDSYKFAVETSDGKAHSEQGKVKNLGTEQEAISVQGSFTYVGDDGVTYSVKYIADENGFQPQGAHLPVA